MSFHGWGGQPKERPERTKTMDKITPCLWFDTEGEEAANFYTSVFPNSRIVEIAHYDEGSPRPAGTVMTVAFELNGQSFTALNGGPDFKFNEAVSLQIDCKDQEEVDRYWSRLSEGGEEGPCGWLKDKYGLWWQVVPTRLFELLRDPDREKSQRVTQALLKMKKIQIDELEQAAAPA
jgi:predicted 3-demethylubiquinone-9 3-methyltransferase (glyoxalase superfamily)